MGLVGQVNEESYPITSFEFLPEIFGIAIA